MQTRAHDRAAFAQRWPALLARIAAAAESGARLVVVPEGTVPGYVIGTDPVDPHQIDAAAQDVIAVATRTGATIVYGGARAGEQGLANSAYVTTPRGIVGYADKCFLWHFDRRWFTAGNALEPVDTPAGRLGVFICADGRIPTIASTLVEKGAEVLVVPTAWVTSGRDPHALENLQADLMIAVRARENGVPLVVANKCGVEARSVAYCGKSQILSADGTLVAIAAQDDEAILYGTVAIGPSIAGLAARPPAVTRLAGDPLPQQLRIAIAAHADPELHAIARVADADLVIDPHAQPPSADVALVDDEAVLDPRALVGPRLDGVRLFVWRTSIDAAWVVPFARTRAAELRAYVVVFDSPRRRAFAVDPDGAVTCGTFGAFEVAAFAFERARTDAWRVAPATDVREGLVRTGNIIQGIRAEPGAAAAT
ncbi:MAG: Nitrilase/cyanide hydratase and apolipoprotein N-acyltransferase [Candidatus Eremiobacteraeota bacterium]|nr:Nitrilase/cyanide hydratase and apolipoprotein N-acyltransferase [Candidatus Eremiobacteraeota bacterium]